MALSPDLRRILKLFLTIRKLVSGFLAKLVHHFFPIIFQTLLACIRYKLLTIFLYVYLLLFFLLISSPLNHLL